LTSIENSNLAQQIEINGGILISICGEEENRCISGKKSWKLSFDILSDPQCILAKRFHIYVSKANFYHAKFHKNGYFSESGIVFLRKNEEGESESPEINWFDVEAKQEILYHWTSLEFQSRVDFNDIYQNIITKKLNNEIVTKVTSKSTGNLIFKIFSKKKK
jgi:hypothetical protein